MQLLTNKMTRIVYGNSSSTSLRGVYTQAQLLRPTFRIQFEYYEHKHKAFIVMAQFPAYDLLFLIHYAVHLQVCVLHTNVHFNR